MGTHDKYIEYVRNVGESLIKNAKSIVGSEQYLTEIYITVTLNNESIPTISVQREFRPERYVENMKVNQ